MKSPKVSPITFNASIMELYHALSSLFNRSHFTERLIRFIDDSEKNVIVELRIKNDTKAELHPGPECNEETFLKAKSAIESEVLQSKPGIGRSIFFSDEPIRGYFTYCDKFQILPPPADAPKPEHILGLPPQPVLLEFAFDKSSNKVINNHRTMKKAFEMSCLLNLFLNRRVWTRDFTLRKGWVDCDDKATKLCTLIYKYKFRDEYSDFTKTTGYKPIPTASPSDYFRPTESLYRASLITAPSNLSELLDKVFALGDKEYEKLLNVAKRLSIASKLWDVSETAAYLATVNTVESLLKTSQKKCEKCKKPIEGTTKTFKDFMDKYTSGSHEEVIKKVKKNIYDTRSKITHGGLLLGKDIHPYWFSLNEDRHAVEGHILRCLVREAVINWFMEQN